MYPPPQANSSKLQFLHLINIKKATPREPMASFPTQVIIPAMLLSLLIGWFCVFQFNGGDVEAVDKSSGGGGGGNQREFDFFKLSLQWPGTICRNTHKCCSSNGCCRGSNSPTEFTIHGLWADYNDGTWPACCDGPQFDAKEISTLLDAMNKYWPSLSCGSPSTCHKKKGPFWAHEWEKHGTCSSPVVRDEYDYFLKTLNLYFKYNVTEVLREAGYVPSNSERYPLGGIISAVQNAFHATPEIECKGGAVEELRLCFFKDFKPRDCDAGSSIQGAAVSSKSSCPKYVLLPAYVSSGLQNNGTGMSEFTGKSSI